MTHITVKRLVFFALALTACTSRPPATAPVPAALLEPRVIPVPVMMRLDMTQRFALDTLTRIEIDANADAGVVGVADYLKSMLFPFIRRDHSRAVDSASKSIRLIVDTASSSISSEGYRLNVTTSNVQITARTPAGLFHGIQTLRQLFPVSIEHRAAIGRRLWVPVGEVQDDPRFPWRGMMLDVSRHFLPPRDVKRFIDNLALYKINVLHLHLADDQGWRIEIKSRPTLAQIGGSSQVGGESGGFYTQDEYRDIVAYAASRFITIVPEIDMPGHTNAALASIPELNCDGVAPPLYTGTRVGFSTVCADSARIYPILTDIVREISEITPGPYFHIGGDEVMKLSHPQYLAFIERMQTIVREQGKTMIGWGEIAPARLDPSTIVQSWKKDSSAVHAMRGGKVIVSPSSRIYLDMQYDTTTVLGLHWAGYNSVRVSYDWDPATFIAGVPETAVLGVEAPLWSETLVKVQDYEYMAFPRIIGVAEIGWSRQSLRSWDDFAKRLELHWSRLDALGVNAGRK